MMMTLASRIRAAESTAELDALFRGAVGGDVDAAATSRDDLCAAAMEKHATDPDLWTPAVAAHFGALMQHSMAASSATPLMQTSMAEPSPLAQQLSKEVRSAVCGIVAYMAASTAVLGAVILVSTLLHRPVGMFFGLNAVLFVLSLSALTVAGVFVIAAQNHTLKMRLVLVASQLYYLTLHACAILGVVACVAYVAMLKTYASDWCARYAPGAAGSGSNSTSTSAGARMSADAAQSGHVTCPDVNTSAYTSLLAGMAFAALFSCAAFLGALEIGARLTARWISLAQFVASDGVGSGATGGGGYAAASDAAVEPESAARMEAAVASVPALALSAVGISTPLSGVTRWVQTRLHLSSLCIAINRRDLERMESKASRCCARFAFRAEALSRTKYFYALLVCALAAIYWLADVVVAAVCWSTNDAGTCAVSNGLSYIINIIVVAAALFVPYFAALFGNGSGPSAVSLGLEPYKDGKANFITAMLFFGIPCCLVFTYQLCVYVIKCLRN